MADAMDSPQWRQPLASLPVPQQLAEEPTNPQEPLLGYSKSPAILRGKGSPLRTVTARSAKRRRRRDASQLRPSSPRSPLATLCHSPNVLANDSRMAPASARKGSPLVGSRRALLNRRRSIHLSSPSANGLGKRRACDAGIGDHSELAPSPYTPSPTKRRRLSFAVNDGYDPVTDDNEDSAAAGSVFELQAALSPTGAGEEQSCTPDEDEVEAMRLQEAKAARQAKLWEAVREIPQTEETYWKSLLQTRLAYYEQAMASMKASQVRGIFNNLIDIQTKSYELLLALRKATGKVPGRGGQTLTDDEVREIVTKVTLVFSDVLPKALDAFTQYCGGYNSAHRACSQLEADNQKFRSLLRKARKEHSVPCIYDLLILPVQRLPRYQILLQAVVGYLDASLFPTCHANLQAAIKTVTEMNVEVDDALHKADNLRQMEELKELFAEESHATFERPNRFFVRHSTVKAKVNQFYTCQLPTGALTWLPGGDVSELPLHFILCNDVLLVALESKLLPSSVASSGKLTIVETVPVDLLFFVEEGDEFRTKSRLSVSAPNGLGISRKAGEAPPALPRQSSRGVSTFQLVSPRVGFTVACKNRMEVLSWRSAFQEAIGSHLKKNPTLQMTRMHIAVEKDAELKEWHCVEDLLRLATDRVPREKYNATNIADVELIKLQSDPRFQEFYQKRCQEMGGNQGPNVRIGSRVIKQVSKAASSPMRLLSPRAHRRGTPSRRMLAKE